MATITDIEIYRGEYITLDFTVDPVTNITGWTLQFTLSRQKNSNTKLIEEPGYITSAVAGEFSVDLDVDQTDLRPGKYYWDVWRTNAGSNRVLGIGEFTILPDVLEP